MQGNFLSKNFGKEVSRKSRLIRQPDRQLTLNRKNSEAFHLLPWTSSGRCLNTSFKFLETILIQRTVTDHDSVCSFNTAPHGETRPEATLHHMSNRVL